MMSDQASEGESAGDPASKTARYAVPNAIARLISLDPGLFAFSVTGVAPWRGAERGLALPAVHVCPFHAVSDSAVEITNGTGRPGAWLGGRPWVEACPLTPRPPLAASAVEPPRLSASGVESGWPPGGAPCGSSRRSRPLLGCPVREKAASAGARFDCKYSGYFQSGVISG